MHYIKLNPQYIVRNEKKCSYIVKLEQQIEKGTQRINGNVFVIPPVVGFIISEIGKDTSTSSIIKISSSLGVATDKVGYFINNLIGKKECKFVFGGHTFFVPPHILINSDTKDNRKYYSDIKFSPFGHFENKRPSVPFNVSIMVTTACHTNCIYCYAKRDNVNSLQLEKIENIIDECRKIGVANVALTGGDIFCKKDWKKLFAYVVDREYYPFLSTKMPLTEYEVSFLREIGLNKLQFSIDSVDMNILQIMIGCSSSYIQKVRQMFVFCQQHNIRLNIRSVITAHNGTVENFKQLYAFLSQFENILDWVITPAFYSEFKMGYKDYTPNNEQLASVSIFVKSLTSKFPVFLNKINRCGYQLNRFKTVEEFVMNNQICHAGNYMLSILPTGICTPCEMLYDNPDFILGNINEFPLQTIWNSTKALDICTSRQIGNSETSSPCKKCAVLEVCRKSIDRRVCLVDISKTLGKGYSDYPDPRCPKSTVTGYIL